MVWTTVLSLPAQSVNVVRVYVLLWVPQCLGSQDDVAIQILVTGSVAVAFSTNSRRAEALTPDPTGPFKSMRLFAP